MRSTKSVTPVRSNASTAGRRAGIGAREQAVRHRVVRGAASHGTLQRADRNRWPEATVPRMPPACSSSSLRRCCWRDAAGRTTRRRSARRRRPGATARRRPAPPRPGLEGASTEPGRRVERDRRRGRAPHRRPRRAGTRATTASSSSSGTGARLRRALRPAAGPGRRLRRGGRVDGRRGAASCGWSRRSTPT